MEAKPTFIKGQKEHKASLIQIATSRQCFIFFVSAIPQIGELRSIMEDENIVKMGIGLSKDRQRLREEFGMDTRNLVDVSDVFALLGRKNNIGSKQLVAHCLGRNLRKSKNMSRSNWAMYPLKVHRYPMRQTMPFPAWMLIWNCGKCSGLTKDCLLRHC